MCRLVCVVWCGLCCAPCVVVCRVCRLGCVVWCVLWPSGKSVGLLISRCRHFSKGFPLSEKKKVAISATCGTAFALNRRFFRFAVRHLACDFLLPKKINAIPLPCDLGVADKASRCWCCVCPSIKNVILHNPVVLVDSKSSIAPMV